MKDLGRKMDVGDVLNNYLLKEKALEEKLRECEKIRHEITSKNLSKVRDLPSLNTHPNPEDYHLRNKQFLRDLEVSRARLRTFVSFTPTDQELGVLATAYRSILHGGIVGPDDVKGLSFRGNAQS